MGRDRKQRERANYSPREGLKTEEAFLQYSRDYHEWHYTSQNANHKAVTDVLCA